MYTPGYDGLVFFLEPNLILELLETNRHWCDEKKTNSCFQR